MINIYIFKNALTSIKRNKGRNILIIIIVTVIASASAITLSIMNSANTIVNVYEEKYDIEATIEMNRETIMKSLTSDTLSQEDKINKFNEIASLTIAEIESYGKSDYLSNYYYTYSVGVDAPTLEEATDKLEKTTTTTTTTTKKQLPPTMGHGGRGTGGYSSSTTTKRTEMITNANIVDGTFKLIGYSSYTGMNDFITGNYTITSGYVDEDFTTNSCVVNEELATLNNLSIGDIISIKNPSDNSLSYELKITGIFTDNSETIDTMSMYTSSVNDIITNSNFVQKLTTDDTDMKCVIDPTYILKDKNDIESFNEEIVGKGLSEYYQVTSNISEIDSKTESITNVKTFATTFLVITLVIGGVVLLVINMINVRERKYEIGVLRTVGMKKSLVISQFVFELMIVSIVGLLLGAGIGSITSVPVANKLLASEIAESQSEKDKITANFGHKQISKDDNTTEAEKIINMNGVTNLNQITEIKAIVDFKVLGELLLIGLFLTLISSISAMISIANFSPLTILKERS